MWMPTILNKQKLLESNSELRGRALEILEAGLEAIQTEKILREKLSVKDGILKVVFPYGEGSARGGALLDLRSFGKVIFVGIGKCALDGAKVLEDILGDYLTAGAVIDVREPADAKALAGKIKYFQGTHPLPSEQNVAATKEIVEMVQGLTESDLVITLISGGGSALFELPDEAATAKLGLPGETSLQTIIRVTKELTAQGADIYALNAERKKMSQVKGGKFAQICAPAKVLSLLFSDVLGNDLSVIASGPTVLSEPSPSVTNILLVSNQDALLAMKSKAEELGLRANIETEAFSGDAEAFGKELARREPQPGACLLFGGETTVEVKGGKGGRNQQVALSALPSLLAGSLLLCAASDGWDNTDHAGAIADENLLQKARDLGLDPEIYLRENESYDFFEKIDGAIYTGKLGSNVSDLCIMIYR